jgi:serine acetyltransferase
VKVVNQLSIDEYVIIGAGAVVIRSIPANCTAVGVPARVVKTKDGE